MTNEIFMPFKDVILSSNPLYGRDKKINGGPLINGTVGVSSPHFILKRITTESRVFYRWIGVFVMAPNNFRGQDL